jgi:hypothetical protein
VDFNNLKHLFHLSYRAFAKEFHAKYEMTKGYKTHQNFKKLPFINQLSHGSEIGLRDTLLVKNRMNEILKNSEYSELEYFTYKLDYTVPITLAASITPDYSYYNNLLNKSNNINEYYEFVNFIIIPNDQNETLIIFSCLPEHKKSIQFIDELSELPNYKLEKAISSLAIGYVENTFIAPSIWNNLSQMDKIN